MVGVSRFDNQYSIHSADQIIYSFALYIGTSLFKIKFFFYVKKIQSITSWYLNILLFNKYGFYWEYLAFANTPALSYA